MTTTRTARTLAITLGAAALATAATVGLGAGPQLAAADPGDTYVALGGSQLLQSEDVTAAQLPFDTAAITVGQDRDFSGCLGKGNSWTAVLKGAPKPIQAYWTKSGSDRWALSETIGQARSADQATSWAQTLVQRGIRDCQKPVYDFRYGKTTTFNVGDGTATTALFYRGTSTKPSGGVVVVRKGTDVGLVELTGTSAADSPSAVESVAKEAVSRLVMSS